MELGCSSLPGWTRGHDARHGGVTIRVEDTLAHVGYHMLQGGMIVGNGTQDCTESGRSVECYIEGCGLMHIDPIPGHNTEWCAGLCNEEKWPAEEHGDTWWYTTACQFTMWARRSDSHCIEDMWGVTSAVTQAGHKMVQDGIDVAWGIQWCTRTCCGIHWHVKECGGIWWYAMTHDAAQRVLGALPPGRLMERESRCTIAHKSPKIDEDIIEHLRTPCLVEAGPRGSY